MKAGPARRIWGLMYRHLALYRGSWPRLLELMYWPVLQMIVWGFITAYLAGVQGNTASVAAGVLLGGVLLWEVTLRSQMGFAISFLEEVWSRNLGHLFVSPLRPWELVAGLAAMSVLRTVAAVAPAMVLAFFLYGFGVWTLGPVLVAYVFALMAMGWAVALAIPAAHVFEGMRAALTHGAVAWDHLGWAVLLDVVWMAVAAWIFLAQFQAARVRGALLNIGE